MRSVLQPFLSRLPTLIGPLSRQSVSDSHCGLYYELPLQDAIKSLRCLVCGMVIANTVYFTEFIVISRYRNVIGNQVGDKLLVYNCDLLFALDSGGTVGLVLISNVCTNTSTNVQIVLELTARLTGNCNCGYTFTVT